jgi:hypothetical protein
MNMSPMFAFVWRESRRMVEMAEVRLLILAGD